MNQAAVSPAPLWRRAAPWAPLYLLGLLPPALAETGWVACVAWTIVSVALAEHGLAPAPGAAGRGAAITRWTRHPAGALAAMLGSVVLLFLQAWGLRFLGILLFLPAAAGFGLGRLRGGLLSRAGRWFPPATVLVSAAVLVIAYMLAARVSPLPPVNDDFLFLLRATEAPEPLTEAERAAAISVVDAAIRGRDVDAAQLPPRLQEETEGRVFVRLFRPAKKSRMARGWAEPAPLHLALAEATRRAMKTAPSRSRWIDEVDTLTAIVDLAGPVQELKPTLLRRGLHRVVNLFLPERIRWNLLVYDTEPGVDGLGARGADDSMGFVLPGDVLLQGTLTPRSRKKRYRMHNLDPTHRILMRRAGLAREIPAGEVPLENFRTYSFGRPDPASDRTVELYRANTLMPGEVDEELLVERIDLAGRWLLGTVEADGKFDYEYFPTKDRHGDGYNEVRHAGSVYGLFYMAHLARREPTMADQAEGYARAGVLALERVYRNLGSPPGVDPGEGYIAFLEGRKGRKSNSGAAALTLLAFLERPDPEFTTDPELRAALWKDGDDAVMEGLAKTLVRMIDADGKVFYRWTEALELPKVEKEPLYFPGEAMLALALYYERTGEARWLDAAKAIGRRQIPFSRSVMVTPDHWVMQALDVLDRIDPDKSDEWRQGAYAMGTRYVREQYASEGQVRRPGPAHQPPFPDYRGAYRRVQEVPRTTRAASRGEAIGGVARIAWRHGDPSDHWERSLLEGARHLMEQQYVEDNSFFLPDPDEVEGAVRMGIIDMHCRIDNNQHAVVGMANALDALRRRGGTAP